MNELMLQLIDMQNTLDSFIRDMNAPKVGIKLLTESSVIPKKNNHSDSGFDLFSNQDIVIFPNERLLVSTGIAFALPENFEVQIRPRSGRAINDGLTVLNTPGTVDEGFTGEVKVILINLGDKKIVINKGDKIAQAVVSFVPSAKLHIVSDIPFTDRGSNGFGSSGK